MLRETPKPAQPKPTVEPAPTPIIETGGSTNAGGGAPNPYVNDGYAYGRPGDASYNNANYLGNKDNMFNIR